MGSPTHFSLEVPKRAHQLLRDLYQELTDSDGTRLPLRATFLLSVSMPIVILPIERILKYKKKRAEGHMNDAVLNPRLADAVDRAIDLKGEVHQAKFFTGPWQYASLKRGRAFRTSLQRACPMPSRRNSMHQRQLNVRSPFPPTLSAVSSAML